MIRATTALITCLLLAACGQKGGLYIPDRANPVAVPATPAASPAPADAATDPTDEEQRQRQLQTAPGNNTGN